MRETLVALLLLGTVAAVSVATRQSACTAPAFEPDNGEDAGHVAIFQKAIWK